MISTQKTLMGCSKIATQVKILLVTVTYFFFEILNFENPLGKAFILLGPEFRPISVTGITISICCDRYLKLF
jgi:hypothetical protein